MPTTRRDNAPGTPGAPATTPRTTPRVWAGLWTIYIAWGSTYLAMRVMVRTIPPLLGASTRFLVAGAIVVAWVASRQGRAGLRLTRGQLLTLAATGALVPGIGNGLNSLAVKHATSVTVALLNAAVPLWVILIRRFARERVPAVTLVVVPIGFSGVAIMLLPGGNVGASALGVIFALGAGAAWGVGAFASARLIRDIAPSLVIGVQMLAAGLVQLVIGVGLGELSDFHPGRFSGASVGALVYLVSVGGFITYTVYAWLLQRAPVSQIATYAFVNPIVAVVLGRLILDESLGWTGLVGAAVIVGSVALTVRSETRR